MTTKLTIEQFKTELERQLSTQQIATVEIDETSKIIVTNYGTYSHVQYSEPSEFWEGETDTMDWTISHDYKRSLPMNMSIACLNAIGVFYAMETRNYSSDLGNGTTYVSQALLLAYKYLVK